MSCLDLVKFQKESKIVEIWGLNYIIDILYTYRLFY